jgi:hypothetical protein
MHCDSSNPEKGKNLRLIAVLSQKWCVSLRPRCDEIEGIP